MLDVKGTRAEQVQRAVNTSDRVFVARLRYSTLTPDTKYPTMITEDAEFEVIEVFKGDLKTGALILVHQIVSGGSCGQSSTNDPPWMEEMLDTEGGQVTAEPAKLSREWLIYSNGPEPYELHSCTRTTPLSADGEKDVEILRKLIEPLPLTR
jgi:hypothetical protein